MTYWTDRYWFDYPASRRSDDQAIPPLYRRTKFADYTFAPFSAGSSDIALDLRAIVGLVGSDTYDSRLESLQNTCIQLVQSHLGMPPVSVEAEDSYHALGNLMQLWVPASREVGNEPTVHYLATEDAMMETDIDAADIELVGPRLVKIKDPPDVYRARIVYQTDVSDAEHLIAEAVRQLISYHFRSSSGETVTMPDLDALIGAFAINPVAAAG